MPYKEPEVKKQKDREYAAKNREAARERARKWRLDPINAERDRENSRRWRKENPERAKKLKQAWCEKNREHKNELSRKWKKANKHKVNANTRERQAAKLNATPAWADKVAIEYVYYAAKVLKDVYKTDWHVDHIVPLKGKTVCGLHVHNNLQLLAPLDNLRKSNKLGGY